MKKEFKDIIAGLGIPSPQRIFNPLERVKINIPTEFDGRLSLNIVLVIFKNKTSFLFKEYELHQDAERIKNISEKLNLKAPGRVVRVDWEINHKRDPRELTQEQNKKILSYLLRDAIPIIKKGKDDHTPKEHDILVGLPWEGSLIVPIYSPENARKRSILNQRFGFGEVDQYNYQYARYNKSLDLEPI